jgi:DnaK suppressor protein
MDLATQSHLKALRDALEYRLAELLGTVRAAQLARRVPIDAGEVVDREDEAKRQQAAELDEAEERRNLDEIRSVEAALHRLAIGRYGDCADCGEPIGLQRLLVLPAAEHCAACQAGVEQQIRSAIARGV